MISSDSSNDCVFDAVFATALAALEAVAHRYYATVPEGDDIVDEFHASGLLELIPDREDAATVVVHPEFPDEALVYIDGQPLIHFRKVGESLVAFRRKLDDILEGVATGATRVRATKRGFAVSVTAADGRIYENRFHVDGPARDFAAYVKRVG